MNKKRILNFTFILSLTFTLLHQAYGQCGDNVCTSEESECGTPEGYTWNCDDCCLEPTMSDADESEGGGSLHVNMPPPQLGGGSQYRKVALNGVPMPDNKPQSEEETDSSHEETYIDAFNLNLVHSVTDVYIPIANSDLALSVRRNAQEDFYSDGLGSHDIQISARPDQPFGVAWSSNIAPNLRIEETTTAACKSYSHSCYVYVEDENGSSHRFIPEGPSFLNPGSSGFIAYIQGSGSTIPTNVSFKPLPQASHQLDGLQNTLVKTGNTYTLTKKFGTVLVYEQTSVELNDVRSSYGCPPDPCIGGGGGGSSDDCYCSSDDDGGGDPCGSEGELSSVTRTRKLYARLTSVTDRFGNQLIYTYNTGNTGVVPDKIAIWIDGIEQQSIDVTRTGNRVTNISCPNPVAGQPDLDIDYTYDSTHSRELLKVEKPAVSVFGQSGTTRPETEYTYIFSYEPGTTPEELQGCNSSANKVDLSGGYHIAIDSITDSNSNTYSFTYSFNQKMLHAATVATGEPCADFEGNYPVTGQTMFINTITLPNSSTVSLSDNSMIELNYHMSYTRIIPPSALGSTKSTTITDAEGNITQYTWTNGALIPMLVNEVDIDDSQGTSIDFPPTFLMFTKMKITTGGESQIVDFNIPTGMAVSKVTDFSGNVTEFEYADDLPAPLLSPPTFNGFVHYPNSAIGKYRDPTKETKTLQTDSGPVQIEQSFKYSDDLRIMTHSVDPEGRLTIQTLDSQNLGRRIEEKIYPGPVAHGTWTPLVGQDPIQTTKWEYHATYKNFVTKKTVEFLDSALSWTYGDETDLVTLYEPDSRGNIDREAIDMNDNGIIDIGIDIITSYTYNEHNVRTSVTDPRGNTTYYNFDDLGRLESVVHPPATSATDTTAPRIAYEYDARGNRKEITDENGNVTRFNYNEFNISTAESNDMDSDGTFFESDEDIYTQKEYNDINLLTKVTDPNGNITRYEYDEWKRLTKTKILVSDNASLAQDSITTFEYDITKNPGGDVFNSDSFKPTKTTDPRGYVTIVEYDSLYRPVRTFSQYQLSPAKYAVSENHYDFVGNLLATVSYYDYQGNPNTFSSASLNSNFTFTSTGTQHDPAIGFITVTKYDALNRPTEVVNSDGTDMHTFYTSTGLAYKTIDELNRETLSEYDAAGRNVATIQPEVYDGVAQQNAKPLTRQEYDLNGNLVKMINPLNQEWDYTFDERNRQTQEQQPAVTYIDESGTLITTAAHPVTTTTYDDLGNVISVTDARNNTTYTRYDIANRPIAIVSPVVTLADTSSVFPVAETVYDLNGNILKQQQGSISSAGDPEVGAITQGRTNVINTYNALNQLTKTVQNLDDDGVESAGDIVVNNEYDAIGNRTAMVDGKSQRTEFEYDGLNRNTVTRHPDNDTKDLAYNAVNQTTRTDELGQITSYIYDARNRLNTVDYGNNSTIDRNYTYDSVGNILNVDEIGTKADVAYTYDALNRISTETSSGVTHTYTYDLAGNRLMAEYGDGQGGTRLTLSSTYDALNRTVTMVENGRTSTYRYDIAGNIREKEQPNTDIIKKSYDALNRTMTITGPLDSNLDALYEYNNHYDLYGNLAKIEETYPSTGAHLTDRTITNSYDNVDRLLAETITKGSDTVATAYTYDKSHNRASKTVTENAATIEEHSYTYNNLNQLTDFTDITPNPDRVVNYTYDDNGNRLTRIEGQEVITHTYDYENRLLQVDIDEDNNSIPEKTYNYVYDYRTRRVERDESQADGENTTIVFSGGLSVQEYENGATTPTVEYIRGSDYGGGIGGILYTLRNSVDSYNHYNSRGDVVAKTDGSGSLTYQAAYEAFGKHDGHNSVDNLATSSTVIADSIGLGNVASNAVDGNSTTHWTGGWPAPWEPMFNWLELDLGAITTINHMRFNARYQEVIFNSPPQSPTYVDHPQNEYTLEYFDGMAWVLLHSETNNQNMLEPAAFAKIRTQKVRLTFPVVIGGYNDVFEFELYATPQSIASEEWGTTEDRQQANTKDEDPTGLLNEGFRYRDLETGTFITRDPMGFVDGPNIYSYVVQNPWTYFDPQGLYLGGGGVGSIVANALSHNYEATTQAVTEHRQAEQAKMDGYVEIIKNPEMLKDPETRKKVAIKMGMAMLGKKLNKFSKNLAIKNKAKTDSTDNFNGEKTEAKTSTTNTKATTTTENVGEANAQTKKPTSPSSTETTKKPVAPGDKGDYGDLVAQKKKHGETEKLDMDHRPSFAAQKKALENKLGRKLTDAEAKALKKKTPAVATPRKKHQQQSRTYGGRNNQDQVDNDAADLDKAKRLDDERMGDT